MKRGDFWHKFDTSETNSRCSHNFHRNENVELLASNIVSNAF